MTTRDILEKLVVAGKRFRATPIVDDDFPAMRDEFDLILDKAAGYLDVSGWEIGDPRLVNGENCMGDKEKYWICVARLPYGAAVVTGFGTTPEQAKRDCMDKVGNLNS